MRCTVPPAVVLVTAVPRAMVVLVAADAQPADRRTPADAVMASMDASRFPCISNPHLVRHPREASRRCPAPGQRVAVPTMTLRTSVGQRQPATTRLPLGASPPPPPDLPEPGHAGIGSCLLAGAFPLPHCSTAQAATGAGRHRACAQSSGQLPREALGRCGRALGPCRGVLTTSRQVIAAGVRLVRFHPPEARPHALVRPVTGLHCRDWNVSRTAEIP